MSTDKNNTAGRTAVAVGTCAAVSTTVGATALGIVAAPISVPLVIAGVALAEIANFFWDRRKKR